MIWNNDKHGSVHRGLNILTGPGDVPESHIAPCNCESQSSPGAPIGQPASRPHLAKACTASKIRSFSRAGKVAFLFFLLMLRTFHGGHQIPLNWWMNELQLEVTKAFWTSDFTDEKRRVRKESLVWSHLARGSSGTRIQYSLTEEKNVHMPEKSILDGNDSPNWSEEMATWKREISQ